jgi:hypothetical protein
LENAYGIMSEGQEETTQTNNNNEEGELRIQEIWEEYVEQEEECHTPPLKTHFKNGDSYQVMTQAIRQEPLLTTLHPLPAGSRIKGGQENSQRHLGRGNPGQHPRLDCFRSTTAVFNGQPYPKEHTTAVDKNLEYL